MGTDAKCDFVFFRRLLYVNSHGTLVFCNVWTSNLPNHNGRRRLPKSSEVGTDLYWSPAVSDCIAGEHVLFPFDFY